MATRTTRGGLGLRLAMAVLAGSAIACNASAQVPGTIGDNTNCIVCHEQQNPAESLFAKRYQSHEFVRLSEAQIWTNSDPHSLAYKVIVPEKNDVAKKMQMLLSNGDPNYRVTEDVRCLTCHATDLSPNSKQERKLTEFIREEFLGISCNACHGVNEKWQTDHVKTSEMTKLTLPDANGKDQELTFFKWRTMTPAYKSEAGMKNLRDPHVKADLCASCHVGNPAENKVITHDMYAAGHPPLPPLELVTFMNGEPRHWGYPSELKFLQDYSKADPAKAWEIFRFKPADKDNYLARHMVAGAMASLKAEMSLLAAAKPDAAGLDYARFDCYSCHHDLKYPSALQERGYEGRVPGRPPLKAWVAALPGTVVAHAGTINADLKKLSDQFPDAWKAVSSASTSSPFAFGKEADVAAKAKDLVGWTENFNKAVGEANYSDSAADQLLTAIGETLMAPQWYGDTEATMHLTWAYRSLSAARKKDVAKIEQALGGILPTEVRSKSAIDAIVKANPEWKGPIPAGKFLPARQKQFANFDPKEFAIQFGKLKE